MNRAAVPLLTLLAAIALLSSTAALAENGPEEVDYARRGPYIGVAGTWAIYYKAEQELEDPLEDLTAGVASRLQAIEDGPPPNPAAANLARMASVDIGSPITILALESRGGSVSVDVDRPVGVNARAGYRVHPRVAIEGAFEWVSQADAKVPTLSDVGTIDSWIATGNVKGYLTTGQVQPFLLAGAGYMEAEVPDVTRVQITIADNGDVTQTGAVTQENVGGFAARFGAGLDIYFTPHITGSLTATYVLATGDLSDIVDLDYISIGWGLGYRF